jgi:hypothetical protein
MHLGKDILVKGNKIYSYETCVFVPQRINELFTKRQNERGDYPIGVSLHESQNRLRVRCNDGFGKTINLGYFENSKKGVIKIKRLAILLMLFSFTLVSCESNKGEWKNEDNNWYYFYSNGEMAHDCYIGNYYLGYNGALTNDVPKPVPPPEVKLYKHISVKITKIQQEYYFRGTFKVYIEYQSDEYGLKESTTIGNNEPYAYECFSGQYKVGDSIQAIMYSWQQGDTVTKRQLGNLDYN